MSGETGLRWMASEGRSDWRPGIPGRPPGEGAVLRPEGAHVRRGDQWKGQLAGPLLVGLAEVGPVAFVQSSLMGGAVEGDFERHMWPVVQALMRHRKFEAKG